MEHSFDVKLAQKYGVKAAIVIRHLQFWLYKNKANGQHQYNGRTWTYNSIRAYTEIFPYWTSRQIRRIFQALEKQDVIIKGNYNKTAYDRTAWYAFKDEKRYLLTLKPISPNSKMEFSKRLNGFHQRVKPIPVNNTVNNTVNTPYSPPNGDGFARFWKIYPKKVGKGAARTAFSKVKPSEELLEKIIVAVEQQKLSEQWKCESGRFIPNPATWLNQERWGDELPHKETIAEMHKRLKATGEI
jgi:hypothetical protein